MKNKAGLLSILSFSVLLTSFGFYVDEDFRNPNILHNIGELVMMLILVFTVVSGIYYSTKFVFKKAKQLLA
jgi:hypothetical protein